MFIIQELLIQQLQDEIARLRRVPGALPVHSDDNIISRSGDDDAVARLRDQLHKAAAHVRQLATDKRVLIEVGNRLRAELMRNGTSDHSLPADGRFPSCWIVV